MRVSVYGRVNYIEFPLMCWMWLLIKINSYVEKSEGKVKRKQLRHLYAFNIAFSFQFHNLRQIIICVFGEDALCACLVGCAHTQTHQLRFMNVMYTSIHIRFFFDCRWCCC